MHKRRAVIGMALGIDTRGSLANINSLTVAKGVSEKMILWAYNCTHILKAVLVKALQVLMEICKHDNESEMLEGGLSRNKAVIMMKACSMEMNCGGRRNNR